MLVVRLSLLLLLSIFKDVKFKLFLDPEEIRISDADPDLNPHGSAGADPDLDPPQEDKSDPYHRKSEEISCLKR
jgi:hypothetical protein